MPSQEGMAKTNAIMTARYGHDWRKVTGAMGGGKKTTKKKGFAKNPQQAVWAARKSAEAKAARAAQDTSVDPEDRPGV